MHIFVYSYVSCCSIVPSQQSLPVDGTLSNVVKWPASTAEVATLPVCVYA